MACAWWQGPAKVDESKVTAMREHAVLQELRPQPRGAPGVAQSDGTDGGGPDGVQIEVRTLWFISFSTNCLFYLPPPQTRNERDGWASSGSGSSFPKLDIVSGPTLVLNNTDNEVQDTYVSPFSHDVERERCVILGPASYMLFWEVPEEYIQIVSEFPFTRARRAVWRRRASWRAGSVFNIQQLRPILDNILLQHLEQYSRSCASVDVS